MPGLFTRSRILKAAFGCHLLAMSQGCDQPAVTERPSNNSPALQSDDQQSYATQRSAPLRIAIRDSIETAGYHANLSAQRHTPWELVHAALGLGLDTEVTLNGRNSTLHEYFFTHGEYFGKPLYLSDANGVHVRSGQFRGESAFHQDQFLACFAQLNVPPETPVPVGESQCTVADLVETAQRESLPPDRTTFTLISLAHYLEFPERWQTRFGTELTVQKLFEAELDADRTQLPCGGAHSLFAIAYTLHNFRGEIDTEASPWRRGIELLQASAEEIRAAQTSDGSINPAAINKPDEETWDWKLFATGHSMEWILVFLDDRQLSSDWVTRALEFIARTIIEHAAEPCGASPWYHAVHSLRMYESRIQSTDGDVPGDRSLSQILHP